MINFKILTMYKSYNLTLGLILVSLLTGCEKNGNTDFSSEIEYVKYGTSFGECLGYCFNDITITSSRIEFHANGWNLDGALPEVSDTMNIDTKYWEELVGKIDFNSFLGLDSIIGCPDCADGGAEWIEIKSKENIYKVIFEYHNEPGELEDYIEDLRTYLNKFNIN